MIAYEPRIVYKDIAILGSLDIIVSNNAFE